MSAAASTKSTTNGVQITQNPLGLTATFLDGRTVSIDVSHYPNKVLTESLLRALATMINVNGGVQSPGSVRWYRQVILRIAKYLAAQKFKGDLEALTPKLMYPFWQGAGERIEGASRNLLKASRDLSSPHSVSDELYVHLLSTMVSGDAEGNPLRPYSQGEYGRLIEACKAAVRQQREAREALKQTLSSAVTDDARKGAKAAHSAMAPLGKIKGSAEFRAAYKEALDTLAPSRHDALPYRILIGLDCGIPAEGINTMRLSKIRPVSEKSISIVYDKNRAQGEEQRVLARKGPWSTPALIDEWVAATSRVRETYPSDDLWLTLSRRTREPMTISWPNTNDERNAFVEAHGLKDDSGASLSIDFRRLRTTWNARNARNWYGMLPTDPNRSATVEADHYLFRSQDEEVVNEEIESAFLSIRAKAAAQEVLVLTEEELADRAADAGEAAKQTADMDMFAAVCSSPYKSPFSAEGELCGAAVWNCLVCPNAIFTRSNLPNLLRLRDHMAAKWAEMTAQQWIEVYAAAWAVLDDRILPSFSDADIATARGQVAADESPVPFLEVEIS